MLKDIVLVWIYRKYTKRIAPIRKMIFKKYAMKEADAEIKQYLSRATRLKNAVRTHAGDPSGAARDTGLNIDKQITILWIWLCFVHSRSV